MSAAEIIRELPQLSDADRRAVLEKLRELAGREEGPHAVAKKDRTVDLPARGIGQVEAADLRSRLQTFAEDWSRPEASIYDEDTAR